MTDHQHPTAKPEGEGAPVELRRFRHKSRGTFYNVLGEARLQQAGQFGPVEGDAITFYRGDDGQLWARASSEFHDGRFEEVENASPPVPAVAGEPVAWTRRLIDLHGPGKHGRWHDPMSVKPDDDDGYEVVELRPTPSADQSGVIGALVDALTEIGEGYARGGIEDLSDAANVASRALAYHAASISGGRG